jgi:hypothetical protein
MANDCCLLVGNLDLGISSCIISVTQSCRTEAVIACGEEEDPKEGPSLMNVNITGYADTEIWQDCPGRAGVSLPFIQKYDCEEDEVYLIFHGRGQSYIAGEVGSLASLYKEWESKCDTLSASSTSGPIALYKEEEQRTGYGLSYRGDPFGFETEPKGTKIDIGSRLGGTFYLQSFSLECVPGQYPTATYGLVKGLGNTTM